MCFSSKIYVDIKLEAVEKNRVGLQDTNNFLRPGMSYCLAELNGTSRNFHGGYTDKMNFNMFDQVFLGYRGLKKFNYAV